MDHEKFRVLMFELLEHHLEMVESAADHESIDYHVDRVRWVAGYLKKETIAKMPTEMEYINYLAQ
jgi:hypothetical protein